MVLRHSRVGNPRTMTHWRRAAIGFAMVLTPVSGTAVSRAAQNIQPIVAANDTSLQDTGTVEHSEDHGAAASIPSERLDWHIPDPEVSRRVAREIIDRAGSVNERQAVKSTSRLLQRVESIGRPEQVSLTLEEALHRALKNSYAIEVQSFNPAVETTRVVQAQSAFDALFFTNITKNKVDRPTGSQLTSSDLDFFNSRFGVRKRLPTGSQVSASYGLRRTKTSLSFQQINPEYFSDFTLQLRQPLLRGFGIDYNQSLIVIARNDRGISEFAFRRQIRDTLREVEELYWRLVQARRDVVITARLLVGFEGIYEVLEARREFDALPVQIAATKANLEQTRADFVQRRSAVFDAEDRLIAAMNDPELNLADNVEIIPVGLPQLDRFSVDRLAEVQSALNNRTEIKEQELRVASAKVAVVRAKNEELPRLDLSFTTTFDGLSGTADRSFDELSRSKFIEYLIAVEFEIPIGNRGPRAAHARARLQHAQAIAQLKAIFESIILDVNLATRRLSTAYDQIGPSFESAEARNREVLSIVARAERRDHNTLINELNTRQSLAAARRNMLNTMVEYNIAIIDLERAKGTLLPYYNVVIRNDVD